jgi:hypothetical protein
LWLKLKAKRMKVLQQHARRAAPAPQHHAHVVLAALLAKKAKAQKLQQILLWLVMQPNKLLIREVIKASVFPGLFLWVLPIDREF